MERYGRRESASSTRDTTTRPSTVVKLERNLRLLLLEDQERPNDPFTLMNLGWAYKDLGQIATALDYYHRSLALCKPEAFDRAQASQPCWSAVTLRLASGSKRWRRAGRGGAFTPTTWSSLSWRRCS